MESSGVLAQEERQKDGEQQYQPPEAWKKMVVYWKQRLELAKQARNTPDRKLDNLSFIQDFYSNEDAVNSYLRPKRNEDDVRIVSSTTEKRVESIVNELEAMNYQHEIQAFNRSDEEVWGLGKAMEDCVTRTNQLEEDEDVTHDVIWELATQRAVFIEEILEQKWVGDSYQRMCRKRVRSALEVIVGDPTMPAYLLQEQPFIALYDRMSFDTAKMLFGKRENFKWVRGGQDLSADVYGTEITFRLGILQQDEVEVIRCMSVPLNEECTFINGVPMDAPGTTLAFQYPFPRYNVACAVPRRMGHHTFYGRSMASALKYLQALNDETVRNLVRKFRQAIEPPRAIKAQERIYTRDMYVAGSISYGVDADALKPLTEHDGVTQGEMMFMNFVKAMQDEVAGRSDIQLGAAPGRKQSATAVVEQQKQAIKMLGQIVYAYTSIVKQMTKNRTYNIIESFSNPEERTYDPSTEDFAEEFHRFTLKDQPLDDGKSGDKIIQFVGKDLTSKQHESISDWEDEQDAKGTPTRLTFVNINKLRKMAINWYVTVSSKPKDNDDLHKLMFQDKIQQAQTITQLTQRPLNGERVINEFEQTWRAKDWFQEQQEIQPPQPQGEDGGQPGSPLGGPPNEAQTGSGLGGALTNGLRAGAKKPPMPSPAVDAKPKALVGAM